MSYLSMPVSKIATDLPGATAVFFRNKINFCCDGQRLLKDIIAKKQLNEGEILSALDTLIERSDTEHNTEEMDTPALIEFILQRYHEVHREQLSELIRLASRVELVHEDHPFCPAGLSEHLTQMQAELEQHMEKEERILFPMLQQEFAPMVGGPIHVMRTEHDEHKAEIAKLFSLTNDITMPAGACNTWRALYLGLQEFVTDLNMHIHIENNILFPRADQ